MENEKEGLTPIEEKLIEAFSKAEKNTVRIADANGMARISEAEKMILDSLDKSSDAKVKASVDKDIDSMGVIEITGSRICFRNSGLFSEAISIANNFEVYPRTDGTVLMNLTFHGLTKRIG